VVTVAPGRREVEAKIDWCGSPTVEVAVQEGIATALQVGGNLAGWRFLLLPLYLTWWRWDYLYLHEVNEFSGLIQGVGLRNEGTTNTSRQTAKTTTIRQQPRNIS
jgi:hypothetical protein